MRIWITLAMMLATVGSHAQTKYDISFPFDGHLRELIVSVPSTPPPAAGYPIVVMLHGTSGDKNVFYNVHGWKELGEQENFVTVFPSALSWCFFDEGIQKQNTKFVCGELVEIICPSDSADLISDVAFMKEIINRLSDTLQVDPERIFVSGFSNGACMTHKLAMDAGDIFRAAGGTGGTYHENDSVTPVVRVPVWFMVGTLDDRFLVPPYTEIPFGGDSSLYYLNKTVARTLASLGLTTTFTTFETALTKTYQFVECQPGIDCVPYRMTVIKELDHRYPNGINNNVDAPALFWDFFNNPPEVTTSTEPPSWPEWAVSCTPNPSSDQILVDLGTVASPVQLTVIHASGAVLEHQVVNGPVITLEKNRLGSGLFFLRLESSTGTVTKKVIFE